MFKARKDVVARRRGDVLILLKTSTGDFYDLNYTGALLWESLIENGHSLDECAVIIADDCMNAPPIETVRTDCDAFISQWQSEKLIEALS